MPVDYSRYPKNWKEIVEQVRTRSGNKCEWCGVENGAIGARSKTTGQWFDERTIDNMSASTGETHWSDYPRMIRIVLTTAHLGIDYPDGTPGNKHDKMDCRLENLAHLCQRCHLNYDRDEHAENRKRTTARKRRQRKESEGQLSMGGMFDE